MVCLVRLKIAFWAPWVLLTWSGQIWAQLPVDSHAKIELIAERSASPTTAILWAGVLFRLDPGWHIYWQNPGDSGEPPKVQWNLPSGFAAGAMLWPVPIRLGSGTVVDYGYENEVLLMSPIESSATGAPVSIASLSADVKYIVCREMCLPGKVHLTLAPSPGGDWERWHSLFEQTRQQLPKHAPSSWRVSAEADKSQFILSVRGAPQVQSAGFFPLEPGQIENSSPQDFASNGTGFRLILKKSDQLTKPISTLRGLIVFGPGRAYEVAAPVAQR